MPNREEALLRIFEATGAAARLSEEQKRELLGHLDDAVEAKIAAGVPEMDAVGQAFIELGDLRKIAKGFPSAAPVVATPDGPVLRLAEHGYALLLFFTFMQLIVLPKMLNLFLRVRVPVPGLTLFFWSVSDAMRSYWGVVAIALLGLAWTLIRVRKPGTWRTTLDLTLGIGGAILLSGVFVGVLLPFVTLLEGLTRH